MEQLIKTQALVQAPQGMASRDPDLVRLALANKLATIDDDMAIKTELTKEEIYALATMKAYIKRLYTPIYQDYPYMDFKEAQLRMDGILKAMSEPALLKDPEAYKLYLMATKSAREYYEAVLDPLSYVTKDEEGHTVIRRYNEPVVYDEFFRQLEILNVSKERKGRLEILNVAIVERAMGNIMKLLGIDSQQEQQKKSLIDKAFGR
jgi:uncharacterized protein YihD (DUF1040 family)